MEKMLKTYQSFKTKRVNLIIFTIILLFCMYHFAPNSAQHFEETFTSNLSNDTISKFLHDLTSEPHVAGSSEDHLTAEYVLNLLKSYGISTHYADYEVLLTYPVRRNLSLLLSNGSTLSFSLEEEAFKEDPYTTNSKVIPTFFAYSPSGQVTAEVVYANYGREEDFLLLKRNGVQIKGAIVIARYGKIYRGDIVNNAALAGAVGCIVYSDPFDYADNGTDKHYPFSQWLPLSGVQRGSLLTTSGDPLTPGWPSTKNCERFEKTEVELPKIPALPISAKDALPILAALSGDVAPRDWHGALDIPVYRLGRGPAKLNFTYEANFTLSRIRNVIGVIEGSEEPNRYVLLGNHRDAWTFGATDPNSGTACLLEIARGFGKLLKQGWKPKRTIVFCNWDAEEYGLVGSTEWVEENLNLLSARAVAYINVDHSVAGPHFLPSAGPQLDKLLKEVMNKVKDPELVYDTVYDSWMNATAYISRLGGGGSDYSPFLQHAGVPSFDLRYRKGYPVYHSLYDDYNWMAKFGDPLFHRHVAVSAIWGLLAMRLAGDEIIPFDYTLYASELEVYANVLKPELQNSKLQHINLDPLFLAILQLREAAIQVNAEVEKFKQHSNAHLRSSINERLVLAERAFTDPAGLTGDTWYKHVVYGPTSHDKYGSQSFPGISQALAGISKDKASLKTLQHEIWKVARAISNAALVLNGKLV